MAVRDIDLGRGKMKNRFLLLAAAVALVLPALSQATVFKISDPDFVVVPYFGGITVSGTLTTDGKTGELSRADIESFDLSLSDGSVTDSLNSAAGATAVLQAALPFMTDGLSVSGSHLNFDFGPDSAGILNFFAPKDNIPSFIIWSMSGGFAGCPCDPLSAVPPGSDSVRLSDGFSQSQAVGSGLLGGPSTVDVTTGRAEAAAAPEIDPDMTAGGLTLLLGALTVLRGRRQKPGSLPV